MIIYYLIKKNLITSDIKGNIIIFSIEENKVERNFNFYKKNIKNLKNISTFMLKMK